LAAGFDAAAHQRARRLLASESVGGLVRERCGAELCEHHHEPPADRVPLFSKGQFPIDGVPCSKNPQNGSNRKVFQTGLPFLSWLGDLPSTQHL
jgi:hypothetical protein